MDAHDDEYSLFDEPLIQDGPDLFGNEEPMVQDGPDLFGDEFAAPIEAEPEKRSASKPGVSHEAATNPTTPAETPAVTQPTKENAVRLDLPEAPLALYRRYRPDTFADVIGQEHVTVPLQRALENNKVGHAYLFSGPRGCGKTTSARILARCLNCELGPTPTPCGKCQSCRDLARGGPGSIDVIEIDAASHGGVDDARDLRERAFFAPVASRYKVYIVDEAHMVTAAGFNALLKLVEEPPAHAKFIFATTEPEKVIGTIRSRTHHYPFRLVPPKILTSYLQEICTTEGVQIDAAALPLVVRAGAGSVRDSLSVLDQLLGGAGESGVEYEQAASLLGYTPESLLDDIVDAFAAGDASGVFKTIDRVIEVGQDPRRFAEDLLRRLRDLVILAAVPTAIEDGILEVSGDQAERFKAQVSGLGAGELTRAAEVLAVGLTEMRGTTAPRLHLELMCARVLLPGADESQRGLHARLDRLERRVESIVSSPPARTEENVSRGNRREPADQPETAALERTQARPTPSASIGDERRPSKPPEVDPWGEPRAQTRVSNAQVSSRRAEPAESQRPAGAPPRTQRPAGAPPADSSDSAGRAAQPRPSATAPAASGQPDTEVLRRAWPTVLEAVKRRRRYPYILLSQNSQVLEVTEGIIVLGFANAGAKDSFGSGESGRVLAEAIAEVFGTELRIQAVVANEQPAPPMQRPAGAPVGSREPAAEPRRVPSEPPDPEPDPEEAEVSEDDAEYDAAHGVSQLLATELGAEVISAPDENSGGA